MAPKLQPTQRRPKPAESNANDSDDIKVAKLSARSALTVAVIAALLSGLFTVPVTIWVTNRQIDSSTAQAKDDFLRAQRQEAYASFLTAHTKLVDTAETCRSNLEDGQPISTEEDARLRAQSGDEIFDFRQIASSVQLLGGREIEEKTQEVVGDWNRAVLICVSGLEALSSGKQLDETFASSFSGSYDTAVNHMAYLVQVARVELGSN